MSHRKKDRSKIEARRERHVREEPTERYRSLEADRSPLRFSPFPEYKYYNPLPYLDAEFNGARPIVFTVALLERKDAENGEIDIQFVTQDYGLAVSFRDGLKKEGPEAIILEDWIDGYDWTDGLKACPFCNGPAYIPRSVGEVMAEHSKDCPLWSDSWGEGADPLQYGELLERVEAWNRRTISDGPVRGCPFCGVSCEVSGEEVITSCSPEGTAISYTVSPVSGHILGCPLCLSDQRLYRYWSEKEAVRHWNDRPGL